MIRASSIIMANIARRQEPKMLEISVCFTVTLFELSSLWTRYRIIVIIPSNSTRYIFVHTSCAVTTIKISLFAFCEINRTNASFVLGVFCIVYHLLKDLYKDTCKCIFCLGAPACLNVFLFFQANK